MAWEDEAARDYVWVHEPGNPQTLITSFFEGDPVDLAIVEGRVRERFRTLTECRFIDVAQACREAVKDRKKIFAMTERVAEWLRGRGMKVWR